MPSSSSESSSSSKGFGARCFWRLMMISPSFLFERTARRVLSSLCFFVFLLEKGPKKKEHLSISLFFLGPLLFYVTFTSRERERDVKKRRGKKATKAPTSSRRQNAKVRRQKKTKEKNSLGNSLSLSCELSRDEKTKKKQKKTRREKTKVVGVNSFEKILSFCLNTQNGGSALVVVDKKRAPFSLL